MDEKRNCWEIKNCGFEPGGQRSDLLGVCPAAQPGEGEGINGGTHRGRICWVIPETKCAEIDSDSGKKDYQACFECSVFIQIYCEERDEIVMLLSE